MELGHASLVGLSGRFSTTARHLMSHAGRDCCGIHFRNVLREHCVPANHSGVSSPQAIGLCGATEVSVPPVWVNIAAVRGRANWGAIVVRALKFANQHAARLESRSDFQKRNLNYWMANLKGEPSMTIGQLMQTARTNTRVLTIFQRRAIERWLCERWG